MLYLDWLQSLKQFFINVPYHLLVASLTLMALQSLKQSFINVPYHTRDVFYVRRRVYLMKTAKVNAYIMHIFVKIELLSIHAT